MAEAIRTTVVPISGVIRTTVVPISGVIGPTVVRIANATGIRGVRYSSVRSEEVPCFAAYHFRTGSRPTVGQMFFRIKMN